MLDDSPKSREPRPAAALLGIGLLEYLDKDLRPTFAFDIEAASEGSDRGLVIGFVNVTLQQNLSDLERLLNDPTDDKVIDFVDWAKDELCATNFVYRDHIWATTKVTPKWVVVSGIPHPTGPQSRRRKHDPSHDEGHHSTGKDIVGTTDPIEAIPPAVRLLNSLCASNTISWQYLRLIEEFDWSKTSLGAVLSWPQPLIHALALLLSNPAPCCIFWGSDRTMIYNEPYADTIQSYHPAAMGTPAPVIFALFWPQFEPVIRQVEQTKKAVRQEAIRAVVNRSGFSEETFSTNMFLPMLDVQGQICGTFEEVVEVTKEVITHRQMNLLFSISNSTAGMTSLDDFWSGVFKTLQSFTPDLPFAAVYSLDDASLDHELTGSRTGDGDSVTNETEKWNLKGSVGFPEGHPAVLQSLDLSTNTGLAPALKQMLIHADHLVFDKGGSLLSEQLFTECTDRGSGNSFSKLAVCPLSLSSDEILAAIVIGANPLRPYDDEYARFLGLLTRIIEDAATSVLLIQKEKRRLEKTVQHAEQQRKWLSEQLEQQTKEARQSELRFYNFAEQAPIGVYILGPEGHIKYCNQAWRDLVGIPLDASGPVPWRTQVHDGDLEAVDQQWKWLTEGRSQLNFEWRAVKTSEHDDPPTVKYLRSSAFPELAEDGSMESVTGILMDVSVHKAHAEAMAEQLTTALEAKRARENFIDMVSHEIRNPLNAMLQCAEEASQLLTPLSNSDEVLEVIETIQYCGRHQKHIIDDVLTISKLDSNLLTLAAEEVMPVSILERVEKIFTSDFRAGGIEVTHKVLGNCDTHYIMDASRILQIMINLVSNACKFLKDRPIRKLFLTVQTSSETPHLTNMEYVPSAWQRQESLNPIDWGSGDPIYVHYSVTDTGPGLTADEMSSLFARFKQASPRTHAQYGGSGLGLFISRQLAEMHGGRIGISSNLEQGSTFAFYVKAYKIVPRTLVNPMPIRHNHQDSTSTKNPVKSQFARRKSTQPSDITILIVEDNIVNQKVLQRQLARIGFNTLTANHGEEALSIVRRSRSWHGNTNEQAPWVSIILCDLEMPVMDGLTCASHIRQWQQEGQLDGHIPMIAVTGNARAERLTVAMETGFDQVVTKPYSVPDLVPVIQQLVARS